MGIFEIINYLIIHSNCARFVNRAVHPSNYQPR